MGPGTASRRKRRKKGRGASKTKNSRETHLSKGTWRLLAGTLEIFSKMWQCALGFEYPGHGALALLEALQFLSC